jgi:hypothetical protein
VVEGLPLIVRFPRTEREGREKEREKEKETERERERERETKRYELDVFTWKMVHKALCGG